MSLNDLLVVSALLFDGSSQLAGGLGLFVFLIVVVLAIIVVGIVL